jgi:hypothetical protein
MQKKSANLSRKSNKHRKLYTAISAALVRTGIPTTVSSIKHFTKAVCKTRTLILGSTSEEIIFVHPKLTN